MSEQLVAASGVALRGATRPRREISASPAMELPQAAHHVAIHIILDSIRNF